jgi:Phage integrase, N-terminal SAM-like domain
LLDQVRDALRLKHYSDRTEESYVYWIRRYILFHNKQHLKDRGGAELETFLTHLAVQERTGRSFDTKPSTQRHFVSRSRSA